ncbi:MAG: methyl-accepting chemotaxis protein [Proteobacteria bacterium]|nr:methyl-accepting chemotaxis protein [Pseudomonadota bacterium]MBU1386505.1 methyl-accepting chemotaxis protein [Pseudomonadota bacterium]MBU1544616.1 methyl-accepting chemotaxis protein [Pseudomonadota bacterium]MBU2481405.1 methyl-accepting chemotaxis protein [Pseudomonadota bacterium]
MKIQWIDDMSLGRKIIGGFLFVSLITILVGGFGFSKISRNISFVMNMVDTNVVFLKQAQELKISILQLRRYEKDFFLNVENTEKQKESKNKFDLTCQHIEKTVSDMDVIAGKTPSIPEETMISILKAQPSYIKYKDGFTSLTKKISSDNTITAQDADQLMNPLKSNIYEFESSADKAIQKASTTLDSVAGQIHSSRNKWRIIIGLALLFAIFSSIIMGIILTRLVTRPIAQVLAFAKDMAKGDLTHAMDLDRKDEIGTLAKALTSMSDHLKKIFRNILSSSQTLILSSDSLSRISDQISANSDETAQKSNTVAAAAEEMSANMNTIASATEQTTANIQMVVSAAEEMTATIQEIANNTAKGSQITRNAVAHAQAVSSKVDELGRAAKQITKVTETIADISEQTNLLALNATIEAARAGEAGKGFAVVAAEIKVLAQQTAEATSEINSRITGVQTTTAESVKAIDSIVKVINEINEIVSSVAAAIEEQSSTTREISSNIGQAATGLEEVNNNFNQISAVTMEVTQSVSEVNQAADQTTADSRQIKENAKTLSGLATDLNKIVEQLKI